MSTDAERPEWVAVAAAQFVELGEDLERADILAEQLHVFLTSPENRSLDHVVIEREMYADGTPGRTTMRAAAWADQLKRLLKGDQDNEPSV